ncbi:Na+/H+ antiporter NhaC [Pontibacillus yanchengensis]|uniref:Na+/H+ antiporter NhaC n=2 Tax=Pontibacillus yanchengensis TaxID=462910 RepID=A0ACC7VJ35_9BACI|nr:Na+/H+ antiporter NhaC [Pontibacillus yanchengensis]MYL33637.1 Na+/H+ antiporter NhaC [Pontibacillus yanchengensis]MYL54149.1 Na+/H+ antiporter NhaC [Pontibacillus yanchengensis]
MSKKREMPIVVATLPLVIMIIGMGFTIIKYEGAPHIPLLLGAFSASVIALIYGYSWDEIEQSYYTGIHKSLPAIVILILVGLIIGSWIGGGVVGSLIYYGLKLISPGFFLVSIMLLCTIVALSIGSSWSTMATIGVAGMGIGISMGIPEPMIAGAIISGAYMGDKMSPLSDTTNLASGIANVNLFEHIKHMLYTTVPAYIFAFIVFAVLGRQFSVNAFEYGKIEGIMESLQNHFLISPWLLLVPVAVIVLVLFKIPALPSLSIGVILGFLCQIAIQGDAIGTAVISLYDGYTIETENQLISDLLNRGGLSSMMYTISLTIVAMIFGGVLEGTGILKRMMDGMVDLVRSGRALIPTTVLTSFSTNVLMAEQYISIIIPARMYADSYTEKGLHRKNLSRAVEDGGTVTSVLVPWNTGGIFVAGTLGVETLSYVPYAFFNLATPIISIIFALIGFSIVKTKMQDKKNHAPNDGMDTSG